MVKNFINIEDNKIEDSEWNKTFYYNVYTFCARSLRVFQSRPGEYSAILKFIIVQVLKFGCFCFIDSSKHFITKLRFLISLFGIS